MRIPDNDKPIFCLFLVVLISWGMFFAAPTFAKDKGVSIVDLTDIEVCIEVVKISSSGELGRFSNHVITGSSVKPIKIAELEARDLLTSINLVV